MINRRQTKESATRVYRRVAWVGCDCATPRISEESHVGIEIIRLYKKTTDGVDSACKATSEEVANRDAAASVGLFE